MLTRVCISKFSSGAVLIPYAVQILLDSNMVDREDVRDGRMIICWITVRSRGRSRGDENYRKYERMLTRYMYGRGGWKTN